MKINELIEMMQIGEEFEVCVDGQNFFLQPEYDSWLEECGYLRTIIFDSNNGNATEIFVGSTETILEYRFAGKYTFKNDLNKFELNPGCYIVENTKGDR